MNSRFLFAVCQRGAEEALKRDVARSRPGFHLAFSRPGFVTFKLPEDAPAEGDVDLPAVFARTQGYSLGHVRGTAAESLAAEVWQLAVGLEIQQIHVWQRDRTVPGDNEFEPGITPLAAEVGRIIAAAAPADGETARELPVNRTARAGECVLDCVLVEPDQWWIGHHRASSPPSRWPGGTPRLELPPHAVSRAYLKMQEALLWSRLPLRAGDNCVEIGSAPGGSCQALLDRGLTVTGLDPAEMDETVLAHPNFTHVRARGADLKRREFRSTRWLMVDSNVAPKHTLDTVQHIVTNRQVRVRGMLLTLKLSNWDLADAVPDYVQRVRSWGYRYVDARQLAFNRQEITLAALRTRQERRPVTRST
jgi:23S rRNA (cytidine2498-2'-O)-methyltransferase